MKPDRVVVGVDDQEGTGGRMRDLYEPFVKNGHPIHVMDIPSAEMVKYAANAMLATKISFINEIAALCEAYGSDVDEVWKRHDGRRPDRQQVSLPRPRLRRILLPQGHARVCLDGQTEWHAPPRSFRPCTT